MIAGKKILILAPHTDDGELGCGGSISRMIREGAEIWYVAFSTCAESLPDGMPEDTLVREMRKATSVLGIKNNNIIIKDYRVRHLGEHRQELLDDIISIDKELDPDLIFMPSANDIHQDHKTVAMEGLRAFKRKTILAYELPWNNYAFNNQAFISLTKEDAFKKVEAIQQYESQKGRQYTSEENILAVMRMHGIQIGEDYAEVFEIPRLVQR